MSRTSRVLSFSVPPKIAAAVERTAKAEQKTKSELFRDMWELYRSTRQQRPRRTQGPRISHALRDEGLREYTAAEIERFVADDEMDAETAAWVRGLLAG